MSVGTRLKRAVHELPAIAILVGMVAGSVWLAREGVGWTGPYPLAIGVGATLVGIGVDPVQTRLEAIADRIGEAVPSLLLWIANFLLIVAFTSVDFPTGGFMDVVYTAVFGGAVVWTVWLLTEIVRRIVSGNHLDSHDG